MTHYNRPGEVVFASGAKPGEVENFPDIQRGWGVSFDQTAGIPPMEWFNALFKRNDEALRYLMQRGLSEWSTTEDYPVGAYVQEAGKVWKAKTASMGKRPSVSAAEWVEAALTTDTVNALIQEQLAGIGIKGRARVASTGNIVLSGLHVIDGVNVLAGDRVLVKNQTAAKDNGIYIATTGTWTRSTDTDVAAEMTPGLMVAVEQGSSQADSLWQLITDAPVVLGTTVLSFEMVFGRNLVTPAKYDLVTVNGRGQVIGGAQRQVINVSSDVALTASQMSLVVIDASAGTRSITLPASDAALGVVDVIVRRLDNSTNRLSIRAAGTDRLRFHTHLNSAGYPFLVLLGAGDWWHLRSDGQGSWWPMGRMDSVPLGRPTFDTTVALPPGGYGALNGVLLNRADWPWLWDHAQQSGMLKAEAQRAGFEGGWTSGDGSTTFRLPDGRGEYPRYLDEGRGVDSGRVAGSSQGGTQIPMMTVARYSATAGVLVTPSITDIPSDGMAFMPVGVDSAIGTPSSQYLNVALSSSGTTSQTSYTPRVRNIAYPGRIKLI